MVKMNRNSSKKGLHSLVIRAAEASLLKPYPANALLTPSTAEAISPCRAIHPAQPIHIHSHPSFIPSLPLLKPFPIHQQRRGKREPGRRGDRRARATPAAAFEPQATTEGHTGTSQRTTTPTAGNPSSATPRPPSATTPKPTQLQTLR